MLVTVVLVTVVLVTLAIIIRAAAGRINAGFIARSHTLTVFILAHYCHSFIVIAELMHVISVQYRL